MSNDPHHVCPTKASCAQTVKPSEARLDHGTPCRARDAADLDEEMPFELLRCREAIALLLVIVAEVHNRPRWAPTKILCPARRHGPPRCFTDHNYVRLLLSVAGPPLEEQHVSGATWRCTGGWALVSSIWMGLGARAQSRQRRV